MAKFGHIKKLSRLTVVFDLPDLGWGPCSLLVAPAGERNKGWLDEVLRDRAATAAEVAPAPKADTPESRDKQRRAVIGRLSRHVIRGWQNIKDDAGAPVECGPESAADFLTALCDDAPDLFDRLHAFCLTMTNFSPALHVEVLTKN
jgi:hypothetical protein